MGNFTFLKGVFLKTIFVLIFFISLNIKNSSAQIVALGGNWSSPGSWFGGFIPTSSDEVLIPFGTTMYYNTNVLIDSAGALTLYGVLCGQQTFTMLCGSLFICSGTMSGTTINVADGIISTMGKVYAQNAFNSAPCSAGFFNSGSLTVGLPYACIPTAVNQINFDDGISIFPNPFVNTLTISGSEKGDMEIIIYDLQSKQFLKQLFSNAITLNTSFMSQGVYLYELKNKSGVVKRGKIVKG